MRSVTVLCLLMVAACGHRQPDPPAAYEVSGAAYKSCLQRGLDCAQEREMFLLDVQAERTKIAQQNAWAAQAAAGAEQQRNIMINANRLLYGDRGRTW